MNQGLALVEQEGQASSVMDGEFFLADGDADADSRAEGERGGARDVAYNHQKENTCPNLTSSVQIKPKSQSEIDDYNYNASLPLKDHHLYKEFFKMLKLGYRRKWVQDLIVGSGLNKKILELDPNLPLAGQNAEISETEQCGQRFNNTNTNTSPSMGTILTKRAPISSTSKSQKYRNHDGERDATDGQSDVIENKAAPKKVTMLQRREILRSHGCARSSKGRLKESQNKDALPKNPASVLMTMLSKPDIGGVRSEERSEISRPHATATESKCRSSVTGVPLKDHPIYSQYFKMLKVGLPADAVKHKMEREGHAPCILDLDPDKSLECQNAPSVFAKDNGSNTPKKSSKISSVRRKKIYWDGIECANNSLWSKLNNNAFESLDADKNEFRDLFTAQVVQGHNVNCLSSAALKKKNTTQILSSNRGLIGGVILSTVSYECSMLEKMVDTMEFGKLTETQLAGLKKILPTEQEAISIKVHIKKGDATNLGTCEKYMLAMLNVEQAAQKLDCMLFMRKFPDKQREVATDLAVLACACEEVVASVHLRDLLAIILSIGNEINAGDSDTASSVKGLKVHDLLKLEKVKAYDNKTSVLQYVAKLVNTKKPELLKLQEELPSLTKAKCIILDTLTNQLDEWSDQLDVVNNILADLICREKTYSNISAIKQFSSHAEVLTNETSDKSKAVQGDFKKVLVYFGEDPAMTSVDFFETLSQFVEAWNHASSH